MSPSTLPPPARFVTATSLTTGESSHLIAAPVAMVPLEGPEWKRGLEGSTWRTGDVWVTHKFPAEVMGTEDAASTGVGMVSSGSTVRYLDIPPGTGFPMHFTTSIDYAVVVAGLIEHTTSNGDTVTLRVGDCMIQRGTMHEWKNTSEEWCRILFVLLPSEEVLAGGKPLEGYQLKLEGKDE